MNSFANFLSSVPLRWWIALIVCVLALSLVAIRRLEGQASKSRRAERKNTRELRALADRISAYARDVHQRFPTGDVVVSEGDLAEQLRKRPEAVVTALNLLLTEQKIQKARLSGFWKLNA